MSRSSDGPLVTGFAIVLLRGLGVVQFFRYGYASESALDLETSECRFNGRCRYYYHFQCRKERTGLRISFCFAPLCGVRGVR